MKITLQPRYGSKTTITEGRMLPPDPFPTGLQRIAGEGVNLQIIHDRAKAERHLRDSLGWGGLSWPVKDFIRWGAKGRTIVQPARFGGRSTIWMHIV